jgi:DNA-directed RNA polymerase specialized sigma subunit
MPDVDDIDTRFQQWKTEPSPPNFQRVLNSLEPNINYTLASMGAAGDPVLKIEALVLASQAVKKYDPTAGASLRTFVSGNLQGLSRIKRKVQSVISLPERTQLDANALHRATLEFTDKHGREPDVLELADHTGLPVKRIAFVRQSMRVSPSESAMEGNAGTIASDYSNEALDMLAPTLPHIDRRILEMKLGYAGHPVLQHAEIAAKLKLSPAGLSRRSAALALKLHEIQSMYDTVYGT